MAAEERQATLAFPDALDGRDVVFLKHELLHAPVLVRIVDIRRMYVEVLCIKGYLGARIEHIALCRPIHELNDEHVVVVCKRRRSTEKAKRQREDQMP